MILHSGSITGTGARVALSTLLPALPGYIPGNSLQCKWVQVITPPTNSASVNFGGSEVTPVTLSPATKGVGFPIPVGWAGQLCPPIAELTDWYDLSNMFIAPVSGDVVYILYGG